MVVTIRYTLFILICMLCQSAFSAVDIVLCEDSDGNQSFQKRCPPGTKLVEKKKISVGKDASREISLCNLNVVLYSIPDCVTCEEVAIYLKSRDISYSEKDVSKDKLEYVNDIDAYISEIRKNYEKAI